MLVPYVVEYLSKDRKLLEGIKGPSLSYFYENMDKLAKDEKMWFFDPMFQTVPSETLDDNAMDPIWPLL